MSVLGYIPLMKGHLGTFDAPRVLEIGIEHGTTTIPLLTHLLRTKKCFEYSCVDVKILEHLKLILQCMDFSSDQPVRYHVQNSIDYLKNLAPESVSYDLVIIDGDHNYHTVSTELSLVSNFVHTNTLLVVDDYSGRWSEQDLWYSERESHSDEETKQITTKRVDTEKYGVKAAVDEFLEQHSGQLLSAAPISGGEPLIIIHKDSGLARANMQLFNGL